MSDGSSPESIAAGSSRPSKISKFLRTRNTGPLTSKIDKEYKALLNESKQHARTHTAVPNLTQRNRKPIDPANSTQSTDEDEASAETVLKWNLPKKTSNVHSFLKQQQALETKNKFDPLNNDNPQQKGADEIASQPSDSQNTPNTQQRGQPPIIKRKDRAPPIYCSYASTKSLINLISSANINEFHVRNIGDIEHVINAALITDHENIKKLLQENEIPFYTYSPQTKKKKILVLKGLHSEYDTEEISNELKKLQLCDVTIEKVEKLIFNKNTPDKFHYLVHLSPESKTQNLSNIKSLAHQRIRWEPFRKTKVFQCFKCQRVGHSSANCGLGFRCVKCTDNHEEGKCPRKKETSDPESKPKCVNCNQDHAANYRGCAYLKLAQQMINNSKAERRTTRPTTQHANHQRTTAATRTTVPTADQQSNTWASRRNYDANFPQAPWTTTQPAPVHNDDIKLMLSGFQSEIANLISNQGNAMIEITNKIQNQVYENSAKIDYIFKSLKLQWQ